MKSVVRTEKFTSDELERLTLQVQELLEANVLAMLIRHPTDGYSITCPPYRRAEVMAVIKAIAEREAA